MKEAQRIFATYTQEQVDRIRSTDTPIARQVSDIIAVWPEQEYIIYTSVGIPTEFTGLWLHDPLTIGVALDRSFIKEARLHVDAEFAPTVILRDMLIPLPPVEQQHDIAARYQNQLDRFVDMERQRADLIAERDGWFPIAP